MKIRIILLIAVAFALAFGNGIYVSAKDGKGENSGSKEAPVADLWKAVELAAEGDTVFIAAGTYSGKDGCGQWKISKSISIIGGVEDKTFKPTKCGQWCNATILKRDPKSKCSKPSVPMLEFASVKDILVQDLVLDGVPCNTYDSSGCLIGKSAVLTPLVLISGKSGLRINGCIVANSFGGGIKMVAEEGENQITNCTVINAIGSGIEFAAGGTSAKCAITNNQVLLTWENDSTGGFGILVGKDGSAEIGYNKIAHSLSAGIGNPFGNKSLSIVNNKFFMNRGGDYAKSARVDKKSMIRFSEICADSAFIKCEGNENGKPDIDIPREVLKVSRMGCFAPKLKLVIEPTKISVELEVAGKMMRHGAPGGPGRDKGGPGGNRGPRNRNR